MTRHFDQQLDELLQRVSRMGSVAEKMVEIAIACLSQRKAELATEVFVLEKQANAMQVEVDERAVELTALHQPMAQDARFLFMASRIGGELERIADQAVNICQNSSYILEAPPLEVSVDLDAMAQVARKMVLDSLSAMIKRDVTLSEQVLEEEERVDKMRDQIFRVLLTHMMSDPRTIQRAISMILVARNLERVGDHATNIAEEVIYWIQGRDVRHGNIPEAAAAAARQPRP